MLKKGVIRDALQTSKSGEPEQLAIVAGVLQEACRLTIDQLGADYAKTVEEARQYAREAFDLHKPKNPEELTHVCVNLDSDFMIDAIYEKHSKNTTSSTAVKKAPAKKAAAKKTAKKD